MSEKTNQEKIRTFESAMEGIKTGIGGIPDDQKWGTGELFPKKEVLDTIETAREIIALSEVADTEQAKSSFISSCKKIIPKIRKDNDKENKIDLTEIKNKVADETGIDNLHGIFLKMLDIITDDIEETIYKANKELWLDQQLLDDNEEDRNKLWNISYLEEKLKLWNDKPKKNNDTSNNNYFNNMIAAIQDRLTAIKAGNNYKGKKEEGEGHKKEQEKEINKERINDSLKEIFEKYNPTLEKARQIYNDVIYANAHYKYTDEKGRTKSGLSTFGRVKRVISNSLGIKRDIENEENRSEKDVRRQNMETVLNLYERAREQLTNALLEKLKNELKTQSIKEGEIQKILNHYRISLIDGEERNGLKPEWSYIKTEQPEYTRAIAKAYKEEPIIKISQFIARTISIPIKKASEIGFRAGSIIGNKFSNQNAKDLAEKSGERFGGSVVVVGIWTALTGGANWPLIGARLGISSVINASLEVLTRQPERRKWFQDKFKTFYQGDPKFQKEFLEKIEKGDKDKEIIELLGNDSDNPEISQMIEVLKNMDQTDKSRKIIRFWIKRILAGLLTAGTIQGVKAMNSYLNQPEEIEEKPEAPEKPAEPEDTKPINTIKKDLSRKETKIYSPLIEDIPFIWEEKWNEFSIKINGKDYGWNDFAQDPENDYTKIVNRQIFIKSFYENLGNDGDNYSDMPLPEGQEYNEKLTFPHLSNKFGGANSNWSASPGAMFKRADKIWNDVYFEKHAKIMSVDNDWGDDLNRYEKQFIRFMALKLKDGYNEFADDFVYEGRFASNSKGFIDFIDQMCSNVGEIASARKIIQKPNN